MYYLRNFFKENLQFFNKMSKQENVITTVKKKELIDVDKFIDCQNDSCFVYFFVKKNLNKNKMFKAQKCLIYIH